MYTAWRFLAVIKVEPRFEVVKVVVISDLKNPIYNGTALPIKVDAQRKEVNIVVIRETCSWVSVPQDNSSREKTVRWGLPPFKWNMEEIRTSLFSVRGMTVPRCERLNWWGKWMYFARTSTMKIAMESQRFVCGKEVHGEKIFITNKTA